MNTKLDKILAEISAGELIDKITILEIKKTKITQKDKLIQIEKELLSLNDTKKKFIDIKSAALINNNFFLFLSNSYLVQFSAEGKIVNIDKLPSKLGSTPIFIEESIIYLNSKNKLVILN